MNSVKLVTGITIAIVMRYPDSVSSMKAQHHHVCSGVVSYTTISDQSNFGDTVQYNL